MPRFDGTGPLGKGPMTGRGEGYCILRSSQQDPNHPDGFAGLQGESVGKINQAAGNSGEEAANGPASKSKNAAKAQRVTDMDDSLVHRRELYYAKR